MRTPIRTLFTICYSALLSTVSCSPSDVAVALSVTGTPRATTELRTQVKVDDQPAENTGVFLPPSEEQSPYRLGVKLLGRTQGSAEFEVSACNSSCRLAAGKATIPDLATIQSEIPLSLTPLMPRVDLHYCSPKGLTICSAQLSFDTPTGQPKLVVEGSGFEPTDSVSDSDANRFLTPVRFLSSTVIETDGLPSTLPEFSVSIKHTDGTAIAQRVNVGIPGLSHAKAPLVAAASMDPTKVAVPLHTAIAAGDLDNDGHADIVIAGAYATATGLRTSSSPGFVAIYYGDGKGQFGRVSLEDKLDAFPRSVTIGIPNPGGRPVLLVGTAGVSGSAISWSNGEVLIYEQTSARTFSRSKLSPTVLGGFESSAAAVLMAPINADQYPDLLVLTNDTVTTGVGYPKGAVRWFRGTGTTGNLFNNPSYVDISFAVPVAMHAYSGSGGPSDVAVATGEDLFGGGPGNLRLIKNNGSGTLSPANLIQLSGRPSAVIAGDFDSNGDVDLAVPSPVSKAGATNDKLDLILNPSQSRSKLVYTVGAGFGLGTAFSLRNDSHLDLLLVRSTDKAQASSLGFMFSSDGSPFFRSLPPPTTSLGGVGIAQVATADFDEDGKVDLAIAALGIVSTNSATSGLLDLYFGK